MQRAGRRRSGKPVLAVVGYTNAGKSSLLQALTHTDAGVEDRLLPCCLLGVSVGVGFQDLVSTPEFVVLFLWGMQHLGLCGLAEPF